MKILGLIGGTGLEEWGEPARKWPVETPYGPCSAALQEFEFANAKLYFMSRHGSDHIIAPHLVNYRANIWAMHKAGIREIIAVNAVGCINEKYGVGALVFPDQLIDYTWGREHTFSDSIDAPLRHIDFSRPFSTKLRTELGYCARMAGLRVQESGCIAVKQGPRLETAAEIRRLRRDGCDLVGMTSMPEAALARELEMEYASVSVVSNLAAGLGGMHISMDEIKVALKGAMGSVRTLLDIVLNGPS